MSRFLLGLTRPTSANSAAPATSTLQTPEYLSNLGSNGFANARYLKADQSQDSNKLAAALLPENARKRAAKHNQLARSAEVASTASLAVQKRADTTKSLVARLTAAGATVLEWNGGNQSLVDIPKCLPGNLLREVKSRGWRVVKGDKPNAEAEHDSWAFGGVGIREFDG